MHDSGHNDHVSGAAGDDAALAGRGLFGPTLLQLAHVVGRLIDQALAPLELSATSFAALRQLDGEPSLSAAELARRVLITPQSVGPVLDRLEAIGLVMRHRSGVRGAKVVTEVTEAGRARLAEAVDVVADLDEWLLVVLDQADRADVTRGVDRLLDRATASGD